MKRGNVERLLAELRTAGSIQELTPNNWMCVHAVPAPPPASREEHKPRTESMIERGEESSDEDDGMTDEERARRKHGRRIQRRTLYC